MKNLKEAYRLMLKDYKEMWEFAKEHPHIAGISTNVMFVLINLILGDWG